MSAQVGSDTVSIPEGHRDILEKPGFAHVATLGPDGEPQSSPVWYVLEGDTLLFSHTKERQKYRNLMADSRIAVSVIDPDNPYRYIEIRGRAEISDDPESELIHRLAKRYMDQDRYQFDPPGTQRVVVKIIPEHVTSMG